MTYCIEEWEDIVINTEHVEKEKKAKPKKKRKKTTEPEDPRHNITGKRIKYLRNRHNLTQEDLGNRFNRQKSVISRWENGTIKPSHEFIREMATLFNVSTDYILGYIDTFHNENPTAIQLQDLMTKIAAKPQDEQRKILDALSNLID